MAVGAIYQFTYGLKQRKDAKRIQAELAQKEDRYTAESMSARADRLAKGYTPQEKLVFFQNLQRSSNQRYNRAIAYRPDMANAISAGIDYANLGAINSYTSNDAALRRQDRGRQYAILDKERDYFIKKQEAAAQLSQAAQQNIIGGIRAEEQDIKDVFSMIYGMGKQSNDGPPPELKGEQYSGPPMNNQPSYQSSYTDYGSSFSSGGQNQMRYGQSNYGGGAGQPYYGVPSTAAPANNNNPYYNYIF